MAENKIKYASWVPDEVIEEHNHTLCRSHKTALENGKCGIKFAFRLDENDCNKVLEIMEKILSSDLFGRSWNKFLTSVISYQDQFFEQVKLTENETNDKEWEFLRPEPNLFGGFEFGISSLFGEEHESTRPTPELVTYKFFLLSVIKSIKEIKKIYLIGTSERNKKLEKIINHIYKASELMLDLDLLEPAIDLLPEKTNIHRVGYAIAHINETENELKIKAHQDIANINNFLDLPQLDILIKIAINTAAFQHTEPYSRHSNRSKDHAINTFIFRFINECRAYFNKPFFPQVADLAELVFSDYEKPITTQRAVDIERKFKVINKENQKKYEDFKNMVKKAQNYGISDMVENQ